MSKKEQIEEQTAQEQEQEQLLEQEQLQDNEQAVEEQKPTIEELEAKIAELEDSKLRQIAEFDNYRRRTNKEKLELIETAGEKIFKDMLPLVDDFERSIEAADKYEDVESLRAGLQLIYQKFLTFLEKNNVKAINTEDAEFSTDEHEAITTFAAGEDKKGKIIDCTQKGYKLGDKVIRFAKVVVGE